MREYFSRFYKIVPVTIICAGIFFRIRYFLTQCSFNIDEARIGVDVYARSFKEIILHQLAYSDLPIPPIGQLIIDKVFVSFFGYHEYSLRLYPLLCGILSIFLFWKVLKIVFQNRLGQVFALLLFCCSSHLIFYSSSAKQYSSDVLVFLVAMLCVVPRLSGNLSRVQMWRLALIGVMLIFHSYTIVFVLPVSGLLLMYSHRGNPDSFKNALWICIYWLVGFAILYGKYFRHISGSQPILDSAVNWFMPKPWYSIEALKWSLDSFIHLFKVPGGFSPLVVAILAFWVGCVNMFIRSWKIVLILIGSVLCVFLAACMDKYPFFERYVTYLVPVFIILIVDGVMLIFRSKNTFLRGMGVALGLLLCFGPFKNSVAAIDTQASRLTHRESMQYFKDHYRSTDFIYVNTASQFLFWYYGKNLNFNQNLPDHSLGNWNHRNLKGILLGRVYDNLSETPSGRFAGVRYETFAYDLEGVFQTKFTNTAASQTIHMINPREDFSLKKGTRTWLIQTHGHTELSTFVADYFRKAGQLVYEDGGLYLFEGE